MSTHFMTQKTGLFSIIILLIIGCNEGKFKSDKPVLRLKLTKEIANQLVNLPFNCIHKEYPNKLNQTLNDSFEMGGPKTLHPAFYGCFDWHSSVHGHWMMVKLLKDFPDLSRADEIKSLLMENITKEKISSEIDYFERKSEKSFERTYGWAWLLKLQQELNNWQDPDSKNMASILQPLSDLMVVRYMEFLPKLIYPVRSGEHPNTAFGLALTFDYAKSINNDQLTNLIIKKSKEFFQDDFSCPLNWEPGGFDFLSPCMQEADLMARILDPQEFKHWLDDFLPQLKDNTYRLNVAKVSDLTDGKLVHLDGVNFCRAWSLYRISEVIPQYSHLVQLANDHINASLPGIVDGGYEGEHWLASFAVYTLGNE